MLFTEPAFLLFAVVCLAVHWRLRSHRVTKIWLLACSYFFYGYWDWRFLGLILLSTGIDYLAAARIASAADRRSRRRWLMLSLSTNLGMLGFFKYFDFFVESGAGLLSLLGLDVAPRTLHIILPVGISFFTFQTMSYSIDVYRQRLQPTRDILDFALYVGFFPQLVAGPIVRAREFLPQLDQPRRAVHVAIRRSLLLFLSGYVKKACIADNIALAIDPVFADPSAWSSADLALAAAGYSIQIYCDFSGYTDMAIAVAGLLGYQLTRNFDFPYFSTSIRDFWRRWHISLSTWLRDYLYISLGGGRGTRARVYMNLMLTMILGGLWHGANLTFALWGALHGLALVLARAVDGGRGVLRLPGLSWAITLVWVVGCFALFRSESIAAAGVFFVGLLDFGATSQAPLRSGWWVLFALLGAAHAGTWRFGARGRTWFDGANPLLFGALYGLAIAVALFFTPLDASPFIYFQF